MSLSLISLRFLSILCFVAIAAAQPPLQYSLCVNDTGFYTPNSTYKTNLDSLLSKLTSNTKIDYGFYNSSSGQNSDSVSAIGLCRGDIKADACRGCLHNASIILPQDCPTNKEAWGGYDECILRYSDRHILHFEDYVKSVYTWNTKNITVPWGQYQPVLLQLLQRLTSIAASGDSLRKFAAAHTMGPDSQTIYAVTQCTPDLSAHDCNHCLIRATSEISFCCTNRIGARVIKPSCNLRYEKDPFYDLAVEAPAPAVTPASQPQAPSTGALHNSIIRIKPTDPSCSVFVSIFYMLLLVGNGLLI